MVEVDDTLNLVEPVGCGIEFGLKQRLPGRQDFEVVLRAVLHQQFRAAQGRAQGLDLPIVQFKATPGRLPLHQCVVYLRPGRQEALTEVHQRLLLLGPGDFQIRTVPAPREERLDQ